MNVCRRNQIVTNVSAAVSVAAVILLVWFLWEVERRQNTWLFVVLGMGVFLFIARTWAAIRRDRHELDRLARSAGINPDAIPEEAITILPPPGDRARLGVSLIILLFVLGAALAHHFGWIEGFSSVKRK